MTRIAYFRDLQIKAVIAKKALQREISQLNRECNVIRKELKTKREWRSRIESDIKDLQRAIKEEQI